VTRPGSAGARRCPRRRCRAVWAALFLVGGCADTGEGAASERAPWTRPVAERAIDSFPRDLGHGVTVPAEPQRILAGSVLAAEVLLSEPLRPARPRLRAVHVIAEDPRYSAVHEEARAFGKSVPAAPEAMLAQGADLILLDAFTSQATVDLMREAQATVVRTRPFSGFGDVAANLRLVGYATGCDREVEELVREMERILDAAAAGAEDRRGFRVMNLTSNYFTYGKGSMMDAVIRHVGATNLAAERGFGAFEAVGEEGAYAMDPDVLVVSADGDGEGEPGGWLRAHPLLGRLACVREGRIVAIPSRILDSTSHHVANAARILAERLDALR